MFHVKACKSAGLSGVWRGAKAGLTSINRAQSAISRAQAPRWFRAATLLLAGLAATSPVTAEPTAPPPPATTLAPQKVAFTDNDAAGEANRAFAYGWPAEVSAIPALAARFTAERRKLLAAQKSEWAEARREFADGECAACLSRDYQKTWEVVANLPRFLSLSADVSEYSGGAHGNYWNEALVWDRTAKRALDPKALFRSKAALQAALGPAWCTALKVQRRERLGPDFTDDGFFPCPQIDELTVLLGSSDKRAFNRIGLIAAPYVAGSYAEGAYEVTLPVTPAVLAAVKPQYKAAFALGK